LYVGNTILVYARRLLITGYANEESRKALEDRTEATCTLVGTEGISHFGYLLDKIYALEFSLGRASMIHLTQQKASEFYVEYVNDEQYPAMVNSLCEGPIIALEIIGPNAISRWNQFLGGHEEPSGDPKSTIYLYQSIIKSSHSKSNAKKELDFFWPSNALDKSMAPKPISRLRFGNSSLCIVKPHAFKAGQAGRIIAEIQGFRDFVVSGLLTIHLTRQEAEEFLEIYRGVVQDYAGMISELSSGRCLVAEISQNLEPDSRELNVVPAFRERVGPSDPELARVLRPHTLRARFGQSKNLNSIHCTDLEEDGPLEVEYFFKLIMD